MTLSHRIPIRLVFLLMAVGISLLALVYSRNTPAAPMDTETPATSTSMHKDRRPPPRPVVPSVTWVPASLSAEVVAGQSSTTSVNFTASANTNKVIVWVSPKIAPYVTVTPSKFASITKGSSYTLQVTFSPSATTTIGTYEGTIHLKQGSKTLAKPLSVSLTVTESISHTEPFGELGITIAYPNNWHSDGDGISYVNLYSSEDSDGEFSPPSVFMQLEKDAFSTSSLVRTLDEYALDEHFSTYAERKHIVLDGHDALLLDDRTSSTPHRPYMVTFVDVSPAVLVITAEYTTIEDYMAILESIDIQ